MIPNFPQLVSCKKFQRLSCFFNIFDKLNPSCLDLDTEVVLVECPVNMLVSIPERLINSSSQHGNVSGLCRPT